MRSILNIGKDLVKEIRLTGKSELLFELFELRTKEWKYHLISGEGGTCDIFSDLHNLEHNSFAFNLISSATAIVLNQNDVDKFTTALSLLYTCIRESNTTEMPEVLLIQWNIIKDRVNSRMGSETISLWNAISKWYRLE